MNREEYLEYLSSEHWQRERRGALRVALYRCQVCNADDLPLEVHHRTYQRLGQERPSDLFVLCEDCHELFSKNGKLAQPDEEDEEWDEAWEDEDTALQVLEEEPEAVGRMRLVVHHAMRHPRLTLGGGSLFLSVAADMAFRLDPLLVVMGLGAAVAIGWKADDLVSGTIKLLVPGSDQEQTREDASRFAEGWLADYPEYRDQSVGAKLRRLFKLEEGEIVEALPEKRGSLSKKQSRTNGNDPVANTGGEGLTYERICAWFDEGRIDDMQFFALLERMENPKSRNGNGNRNGTKDEHEEAPEADVSTQMEPLRPSGWDETKEFQLIGAFLATNHLDNSLKALGLSTSQVNRNFARELLKKQGLWKEK